MSLQKQSLPVKLGSLDTLTDLRQLPIGALTLLENMYRGKGGAYQKRNGASLKQSLASSTVRTMSSYGDELVDFARATATTPESVQVSSYSTTRARMDQVASFTSCLPKLIDIFANESSQSVPDVAINGNYALIAWEDASISGGVRYHVRDLATGTILLQGTVSVGNKPKCASSGTNLMLFTIDTNTITVRRISVSGAGALSITSTTTVASNAHANHSYDVQARADATKVAVAYHSTVPDIKCIDWNTATDTAVTTTTVAERADRCICWHTQDWNTANVFLCYADSVNGVRETQIVRSTFAFSSASAVEAGATDVRNITGYYDGSNSPVYYEMNNASPQLQTIRSDNAVSLNGYGLASKIFKAPSSNQYSYVVSYGGGSQKTYFVCRLSSPSPLARILYGNGGGLSAKRCAISNVSAYGSLSVVSLLRATRLDTVAGSFVTQTNPVLSTLDYSAPIRIKELGGTLFISGGVLRTYDIKADAAASSVAISEAGPLLKPEPPTLTPGAGGSLTASKVYKYCTVFCEVDGRGRIRRSAPSDVVSVTLSSAQNQVAIVQNAYYPTSATACIEVYRSDGDGAVFYRLEAFGSRTNPSQPTGGNTVSFTDTLSDTTLTTQEQLYSLGELENYAAPPFKDITIHRARVWGINSEDDRELWFSKEIQSGLGVGFHPNLKLRLEGDDGGAFCLAAMDDKIVAFKRNSIYVTSGDGPDNTGGGNFFPPFNLVARNVGCVEPESVLLIPDGIVFRSLKGFWLLSRGLDLTYIGAPVAAYNSLDVTAAVLVEGASHARFTTSSGRTLIYDYFWKEWTTSTGQASVSAVNYGGVFTYINSSGQLLQEDASLWGDNGSAIQQAVEFAPIAASGAGGWERVFEFQVEGEYLAASTIAIKVAYDFESTNQETLSLALGGIQVDSQYRVRGRFSRRNCESFRIRIEESSTSQGFSLAALMLIIGVKGGKGSRIPAANAAT